MNSLVGASIACLYWSAAFIIVWPTQQSRACCLTALMSCRNQGCPDMACRICMQNPNRRCRGNFADKYLAGDVLKATCGAPIRVEIINRTTGDSPSKQEYADVFLEVPHSDNFAIGYPLIGMFTLIACCSCQGIRVPRRDYSSDRGMGRQSSARTCSVTFWCSADVRPGWEGICRLGGVWAAAF